MPKRFSKSTRLVLLPLLSEKQANKCLGCNNSFDGEKKAEIDHIDGNPWNNEASNLRLMCHSCNVRVYREQHKAIIERVVRERDSKSRPLSEELSWSNERSDVCWPRWHRWSLEYVRVNRDRPPRYSDLVSDGARFSGVRLAASYRYAREMCSPSFGPFQVIRSETMERVVVFRRLEDYSCLIDELLERYPVDGVKQG